jgi:hypothetical protein
MCAPHNQRARNYDPRGVWRQTTGHLLTTGGLELAVL